MSAPDRLTIGPYRIVARVGAGGMGEVFKAWDPRLDATSPSSCCIPDRSGNPHRQRRLLAEGRAASALNHPNILRVYDADVDGTSYYLVSEWLEGKSLRDELARGPLPLRRLLDLSVQIADGLAAAHSMGIVHRDIKPANVMLARDGSARIVDFGLSRANAESAAPSDAEGLSATVSVEGGASGTPAYMSPEQARGAAGDFRTDQFSFGALLYEMATGQRAFRRETVAETLSAVVHHEPQPIGELNPRVPAPLRWIVERCLSKDANERYSATDDLARELRWLRDRLPEALAESRAAPQSTTTTRWWKRTAAAIVILGVGVTAYLLGVSTPGPTYTFTPIASAAGYEGLPAWSPDGQSLAWVADVDGVLQVFVRRLSDSVARQVTHRPFDATEPFWAPDGQRIYFLSAAGQTMVLWAVGAAGGRPEIVLEHCRASGDRSLWTTTGPHAPGSGVHRGSAALVVGSARRKAGSRNAPAVWRPWLWPRWTASVQSRRHEAADLDRLYNQQPGVSPSNFYVVPLPGGGPAREVLTTIAGSVSVQPFAWLPDSRHVVVSFAARPAQTAICGLPTPSRTLFGN